jgi:hypothetical protein
VVILAQPEQVICTHFERTR